MDFPLPLQQGEPTVIRLFSIIADLTLLRLILGLCYCYWAISPRLIHSWAFFSASWNSKVLFSGRMFSAYRCWCRHTSFICGWVMRKSNFKNHSSILLTHFFFNLRFTGSAVASSSHHNVKAGWHPGQVAAFAETFWELCELCTFQTRSKGWCWYWKWKDGWK